MIQKKCVNNIIALMKSVLNLVYVFSSKIKRESKEGNGE